MGTEDMKIEIEIEGRNVMLKNGKCCARVSSASSGKLLYKLRQGRVGGRQHGLENAERNASAEK